MSERIYYSHCTQSGYVTARRMTRGIFTFDASSAPVTGLNLNGPYRRYTCRREEVVQTRANEGRFYLQAKPTTPTQCVGTAVQHGAHNHFVSHLVPLLRDPGNRLRRHFVSSGQKNKQIK